MGQLSQEQINADLFDEVLRLKAQVKKLNQTISRCRCEECGNELGNKWNDSNGILCGECFNDLSE